MIADHAVGPASPFGGFKSSGIGRAYGRKRLEEYFELQSVAP
jgi:acyl-CoA reductase-like NAD-dependent aldehyde dehydrogenase